MEYKELTKKIIGCAYRVYNKTGFGFLERVYEKCMLIELRKAVVVKEKQECFSIQQKKQIKKSTGPTLAEIFQGVGPVL